MRRPYTQLYVHLVWATWDRLPFIQLDWEDRLYAALKAKAHEFRCETLAIGGMEDHVHLLVQLAPTVSISELVKELKGGSSHLVTHEIDPPSGFKWQGYYGAFSVSKNGLRRVEEYIWNQKEHHRIGSFAEEWERCFIED